MYTESSLFGSVLPAPSVSIPSIVNNWFRSISPGGVVRTTWDVCVTLKIESDTEGR